MSRYNVPVVYELHSVIGAGGFADVHRGRRRDTGSVYAVKILREAWDPCARQRFVAEARHQLRAQGNHVVRIVDWNLEAPEPFIVQEYMPEGSLEERLIREREAGQYTWRTCCALRAMTEVAEALTDLHSQGYVHRDVKPGNLLFDQRTGRLKLNDFGCSATVDARLVSAGFCGTPAYAAPEQEISPGPKSDIYPLGVMLHELLAGSRLPTEWWNQSIAWPSQIHTCGLGVEIDQLIRWLASPNPLRRPTAVQAYQVLNDAWARYSSRAA
ncbi:serine/threonine-protein kinase [Chondromyces crocatus]|uniref:Protein kinase domain-containing protein n=1 Tax=Chondromyces crocatus TaxID=52 RepID=A0A0K1ESC2_CHOCO|nr:serine/threonine-protein kinase [Chondromyces crocatus]AKT43761.1 uncharacterized protein CMC5_079970 [Chondromyces crocatus]